MSIEKAASKFNFLMANRRKLQTHSEGKSQQSKREKSFSFELKAISLKLFSNRHDEATGDEKVRRGVFKTITAGTEWRMLI